MSILRWLDDFFSRDEKEKIKELESSLKEANDEIDHLNFKIVELENQMKKLEDEKNEFENAINNLNYEINSLETLLNDNSEPPEWLDTSQTPYAPTINIVWDNNVRGQLKIPLRDYYTVYPSLVELVKRLNWRNLPFDEKIKQIWAYVVNHTNYSHDTGEDWRFPVVTDVGRTGDCLAHYEKIVTADGLKPISEIHIGDFVWSYNFEEQVFELKRVTNKWYKGKLKIARTYFKNGTFVDFSEHHPMLVRFSKKKGRGYRKQLLSEINLAKWNTRKVPFVRKLPKTDGEERITVDEAFLCGYYVAEGWNDGYKKCICGRELDKGIFDRWIGKKRYNKQGVAQATVVDPKMKKILSEFGKNAFNKCVPDWFKKLPKSHLRAFLDGLFLGDGHYKFSNCGSTRKVISTSSERLVKDLLEIGMMLGDIPYVYKQKKHGGLGKKPIYRLHYFSQSIFKRHYGFKNLSEVSIRKIELLDEKTDMYDIEVEGNHNFVLWNGVVTHNCDDLTILFVTLCRIAGVPANRVFNATGWYITTTGQKLGHSFPIVKLDDGKWYVCETTWSYMRTDVPKRFLGSNYDASWGVSNWEFIGKVKPGYKTDGRVQF